MKRQKRPNIPKYLSESEIERLFHAITSRRDTAIFRLAYHRGLRASEVGILQLADFRREAGRLLVRRLKGSVTGEFRLLPVELASLRAWLRERGTAPGPLFPSQRKTGIGRAMLHLLMRHYCAAAGIPLERAHFHCLKHSCGTHLLAMEHDITVVQDWLGHADIRNTMIYARLQNVARDAAADRRKDWR